MKSKNIKSVLTIILSIVILLTALTNTVMADEYTKEEKNYGKLCSEISVEVAKLNKLFYQTVKTNDLEALIVIAVEINNTFEPHYHVSSPSKRFDQMYYYMKNAADAATSVPYYLALAYNHGDESGLINANKYMVEMAENLTKLIEEIEKHTKGEYLSTISPEPDGVKVTLNGASIKFDQSPIIENGRTLVPLRAIFEALGATVEWDGKTQTVTAVKGDITISMQISNTVMQKNGNKITLDVPPKIVNDRTLVPVRAVAESFGVGVDWNGTTQTVILSTEKTSQASNAASLTMYNNHPTVPNFGTLTGRELSSVERVNQLGEKYTAYFYELTDDIEDAVNPYIKAIKDSGFELIGGDNKNYPSNWRLVYKKGDTEVTIGVMTMASVISYREDWGSYFCVIVK